MPRRSFVQINGKLYERGVDDIPEQVSATGAAIIPDLPDFVSPIDGKVYSGRAGMRNHCARHDVVPTADLKGLPIGPPQHQPDRTAIREELKKLYYK
jgi:hypothetical protein